MQAATKPPCSMNIKAIRERLGTSQADFVVLSGAEMALLRRAERSLADLPTTALAPKTTPASVHPTPPCPIVALQPKGRRMAA